METAVEGALVMVKLSDGEDVLPSLEAACAENGIDSGAIHWAIGMLQKFEIGFFAPTGYERHVFEDRHELLAFHGSIAMRADPKFHIHVALGGRDHRVVGGHLFRARCCVMNEICIERFDAIRLNRRRNPATTLNELTFE